MMRDNSGATPILKKKLFEHDNYFACPSCWNEVGGYVITGSGEDDWDVHQDKFCSDCGQKINWEGVKWEDIHKFL